MNRALSALLALFVATNAVAQQPGKIGEKASPDRKEKSPSPAPPPPPSAAPAPPAQPAPKPDKVDKKASVDDLLKTADEIVKQTAAMRQLAVKQPVKRGVLTREAIRVKIREQIGRQYTSEEILKESRVLKALGLLPADIDYEKLQLDLLMEQVGGFYDPWGKQLYIADWLPFSMQPGALAHEIVHALQDQHFNLQRFVQAVHDQGDRQLARGALVEGDATGLMVEFVTRLDLSAMGDVAKTMDLALATGLSMTGEPMPVMQKAPAFVKSSMMFPYIGGLGFIQYIRKRYPWSKVNEVYKHPPDSTEQILHPEKYAAKEQPIWLKAAPLATFKGKKVAHEDTIGEQQIRLWLQIVGGGKNAVDAAAGWGGDRLVAYDNGADAPYSIVWLLQWDTEADAAEFAAAAKSAIDKVGGWMTPPKGNQVVVELNVAADARQKVADDVMKTWKPGRAPAP